MRELIYESLGKIEQREDIRILHAVESGSRAWGFPSPDSDYDVRFIYVRRPEFYLKLEKTRDVIELPISDMLDINGWDLCKALRLMHGSNPTLFEWMASPIVYRKTGFPERLQPIMETCFCPKKGLYHYLSMADRNYQSYLTGDMVRAKKYFYVLRPVLACLWILDRQSPPPMLFGELMEAELDERLRPAVDRLLDLKMNMPEVREIPRVERINRYLTDTMSAIREKAALLPKSKSLDWTPLNRLFLDVLSEWPR